MMIAGLMHFIKPKMYFPFIPDFFPEYTIVYLSGIVEFVLGLSVFYKPTRQFGNSGILLLMIVFLPLHFIDMFLDQPAIGSRMLALMRFPAQLLLIWIAWFMNCKESNSGEYDH
ncbi:MAG: hypothetical protein H7329_16610 [Opitutaceae bacterium]|nr:hypothetical protein [Cytophagales bacterium]